MAFTAVLMSAAMVTACGSSSSSTSNAETEAAETEVTAETGDSEASGDDLNSKTLDEIIEAAKAEGKVESVGMPDSWANWGLTWDDLKEVYGIDHADADMSSSEELQMFATEGENGTKDIGDVGFAFASQAVEEDLVQGYKTSYWDSVPDWAKGEDGKWMIAYTGCTTFLTNTDLVSEVPTSWEDVKNGDYSVAIGDINGGTAQAAVIASAYAFGGDLDNLDPAFEFWTEMAEAGRINTLDITQQNFETGEVAMGVIWSYTAIPYKQQITQYAMEATIPSDGSIMSGYASVINKYAPHPNAAALAREYIFSDEGQANLALAGAIPTRTDVEIPEEIQEQTFKQSDYADAIPMQDAEAYAAACEIVKTRWEEEILPLLVQ
jgi:putative spermidine/putrescine transport system substrate-binding protein